MHWYVYPPQRPNTNSATDDVSKSRLIETNGMFFILLISSIDGIMARINTKNCM